jgi:hypothetical protein
MILKYQLPTNHQQMIMDVTIIHEGFSMNALQHNFNMLKWSDSRASSEVLRSYAQSEASNFDWQRHSKMNSISTQTIEDINDVSLTEQTNLAQADQPAQFEPTEQQTATVQRPCLDKPKQHESEFQTLAELVKKSKPDNTSSQTWSDSVEEEEQMKTKATQDSALPEETKQSLLISQELEDHVVSDLLLASIMAHNLHQKKRTDFRVDRLYDSMIAELTYRSDFGPKYKFSGLTDLDHQIALAKELQCNHSYEDIFNWTDGLTNSCQPFCLLNFPPLNINSSTAETDKMADVFLKYVKSVITTSSLRTSQKTKVIDKLKADLISRGYHTTYNWVRLRMKTTQSFQTERTSTLLKKEVKPDYHASRMHKWIETQSSEHKCPPIDERIVDLISNNLSKLVLSNIQAFKDRLPNLPKGIAHFEYFYHLTEEFIKHNKGWMNSNSLTDTSHLKKIERYTRIRFPDTEALSTITILKAILADFRIISKPIIN